MSVPQYTTPTFLFVLDEPGLDLTQASNVYVTFESGSSVEITKSGDDLEITETTIGVKLKQKETALFAVGDIEIQANWTTAAGDRAASEVVKFKITKQLLKEVIA